MPVRADTQWFKSSRSGNNGTCVEIAFLSGAVAARDSKNPDGPALVVSTEAWDRFVRDAVR